MKYNDVIDVQVTTAVANLAAEPVTLAQVKRHLSLQFDTSGSYQFDDDDTKLEELIVQSREYLEQYTGLSLATKTYKAILRNDCGGIEIPYGPITAITTIKDSDGIALVDGTTYQLRGNQFKWIESPLSCYIEVVYVSGYTSANIPAGLKRALLEQIAFDYVNAGDQQQQFATANVALCESAIAKAAPYKRTSMVS
jgi:uncharacterized phiE125 gp8 family phage protein